MERVQVDKKAADSSSSRKSRNKKSSENNQDSTSRLRVSKPEDAHEKEADAMAEKVVNQSGNSTSVGKQKNADLYAPYPPVSRMEGNELSTMSEEVSPMKEEVAPMSEEVSMMSEEVSPMSEEVSMRRAENAEDEMHSSYSGEDETIEDEMHGSLDTKSEPGVYTIQEEVSPMRSSENAEDETHSSYSDENETVEDEMHGSLDTMQEEVSRKAKGGDNRSAPKGVAKELKSSKGGGSALPEGVRDEMEKGFGADLSNVRIHTDKKAESMNKNLNAQAFAHENDIYFNSNKFDPNSKEGKHLLAHEITHTLQQQGVQKKEEMISISKN